MAKKTTIPAALPPARQAILDHRMTVATAEAAHEAAVVHRDQLLEVVEGPARTEAQIREAIAADKDALAEWIRSGDVKTSKRTKIDVARRLGLEADLETARHAAEVAEAALIDAESEVQRTGAVLAELNAKIHVMNRAAILEFADQIAQDYMEHFSKMVVNYTILKGLDLQMLAEGPSGIGIMSTTLTAPTCNLPAMPFRHFGDLVEREVNP